MTKQSLWEQITFAASAFKSVWLDLVILERLVFAIDSLALRREFRRRPNRALHSASYILYFPELETTRMPVLLQARHGPAPHHNVVCGDVIIAAAGNYASTIFRIRPKYLGDRL